jgi:hypothetical protein
MKKTFYSLIMALILISSCQPKSKTVLFEKVNSKEYLTKTLDTMYLASNIRDIQKEIPFLIHHTKGQLFSTIFLILTFRSSLILNLFC